MAAAASEGEARCRVTRQVDERVDIRQIRADDHRDGRETGPAAQPRSRQCGADERVAKVVHEVRLA